MTSSSSLTIGAVGRENIEPGDDDVMAAGYDSMLHCWLPDDYDSAIFGS